LKKIFSISFSLSTLLASFTLFSFTYSNKQTFKSVAAIDISTIGLNTNMGTMYENPSWNSILAFINNQVSGGQYNDVVNDLGVNGTIGSNSTVVKVLYGTKYTGSITITYTIPAKYNIAND
jgi:hypothetical protein